MRRKNNEKMLTKTEYETRIVVKSILIAIALFITAGLYIQTAILLYEDSEVREQREAAENCVEELQTGDYGTLRETLMTYNMYADEYDRYWEMADAYEDYRKLVLFQTAAERDDANILYEDRVSRYKEKLRSRYENCQFEENKERLEKLLVKSSIIKE